VVGECRQRNRLCYGSALRNGGLIGYKEGGGGEKVSVRILEGFGCYVMDGKDGMDGASAAPYRMRRIRYS